MFAPATRQPATPEPCCRPFEKLDAVGQARQARTHRTSPNAGGEAGLPSDMTVRELADMTVRELVAWNVRRIRVLRGFSRRQCLGSRWPRYSLSRNLTMSDQNRSLVVAVAPDDGVGEFFLPEMAASSPAKACQRIQTLCGAPRAGEAQGAWCRRRTNLMTSCARRWCNYTEPTAIVARCPHGKHSTQKTSLPVAVEGNYECSSRARIYDPKSGHDMPVGCSGFWLADIPNRDRDGR